MKSTIKPSTLISALIAAVILPLSVGVAQADASATSSKWRIEVDGQPLNSGQLVFRVTPRQGEATDIAVNIRSGRAENNVAKDVRDAFASSLSPQRYTVEVDDGEDILIKKKEGQPDFSLELMKASVQNLAIKVEGE